MLLSEVIDIIERVAPLSIQEEWDNSGLQVGDKKAEVSSVLLCTDVSEEIVDEAIAKRCELIISHHPLLFHELKHITGDTPQERCVIRAIQHNIAIYSSHTSMDSYLHGVSGKMAEKLGITDYTILVPSGEGVGLGVIGTLPQPTDFEALLQQVKTIFHAPVVRYTYPATNGKHITKIALCGGAGSEFLETAIEQGAEVFISADFKYHEFQASYGRIAVMDIGHFESEQYTKEIFQACLAAQAPALKTYHAENDYSRIYAY